MFFPRRKSTAWGPSCPRSRTTPTLRTSMRSDGLKAAALFGIVAVILATVIFLRVRGGGAQLDAALCDRNGPRAEVVVLVDPTDLLSIAQAQMFRTEMANLRAGLRVGDRLRLVAIMPRDAASLTQEVFSRCLPPQGHYANPVTENPPKLQKRYIEHFEHPLEQAMASLTSLPRADTSPILAALYEVLRTPAYTGRLRMLLIVSDLMEHTPEVSFYRVPQPPFSALRDSLSVSQARGALAGVEVIVLLRTGADTKRHHTEAHEQFWRGYMEHAGARSFTLKKF